MAENQEDKYVEDGEERTKRGAKNGECLVDLRVSLTLLRRSSLLHLLRSEHGNEQSHTIRAFEKLGHERERDSGVGAALTPNQPQERELMEAVEWWLTGLPLCPWAKVSHILPRHVRNKRIRLRDSQNSYTLFSLCLYLSGNNSCFVV